MRQLFYLSLTALIWSASYSFHHSSLFQAALRKRQSASFQQVGEEVECFDVDFDVERLDLMNAYITDVKQKGYVPASSNIVYDCTHGHWLLMQVVFDRKIRVFSSRSTAALSTLSSVIPDEASIIYTGTVQPKHTKRLLKMKNLHSIVISDANTAAQLSDAITAEHARLQSKELSKVSQSRGKFLASGSSHSEGRIESPDMKMLNKIRVFLRLDENSTVNGIIELIKEISEKCKGVEVMGLWGQGKEAYELLLDVKENIKMPKLKVSIPYKGVDESFKWNQTLGEGRGSIIWTFEFE